MGPGFDYQFSDSTRGVLNYLHSVSEEYGEHNNNVLELGMTHKFAETDRTSQAIKCALDVGLDGQRETPNLGARLEWEISIK